MLGRNLRIVGYNVYKEKCTIPGHHMCFETRIVKFYRKNITTTTRDGRNSLKSHIKKCKIKTNLLAFIRNLFSFSVLF